MRITTTAPMMGAADWLRLLSPGQNGESPWENPDRRVFRFSRGAWAMQAVAAALEAMSGRKPVVWVPDYFCNQPLGPLRDMGAGLAFYPVGEDLAPNWTACGRMAAEMPPDLFVLVHYFGYPADAMAAREFADRYGALLMEDAAHCAMPSPRVGTIGDVTFFSLYKHLPVPDGAMLTVRTPADGLADAIEHSGVATANTPNPTAWLAKRAVQTVLPFLGGAGKTPKTIDEDPAGGTLAKTPRLSPLAHRLLRNVSQRLAAVARQRRENEAALRDLFGRTAGLEPLFPAPGGETVPYRAVFRAPDPDIAASWYSRIRNSGNAVESWPDLPPEIRNDPESHEAAIALRRTVLCLPIHADRSAAELCEAYGAAL